MKYRIRRFSLLLAGSMMLTLGACPLPAGAEEAPGMKGEAIVCYMPVSADGSGTAAGDAERELEKDSRVDDAEGLMYVDEVSEGSGAGFITLVRSESLGSEELVEVLSKRKDIVYAEPNYTYSAAASESYTEDQWEHSTPYGIHDEGWNTFDAEVPTPKVDTSDRVVAVIDSGIDYEHEDLKDAMWTDGEKYPELTAMGGGKYGLNAILFDENGNKYKSTKPRDDYGHGTHVAGIIAADWNKIGTSGVMSGAKLMAVKISDNKGHFHLDAMIRGYRYVIAAKKAGVNVVATNNSYGGNAKSYSETLVLREASEAGIINVFAAGNQGTDLDTFDSSNALRGKIPGNLVVGCSDRQGSASSFSNYGIREVDVFAPGEEITSAVPMGTGASNIKSRILTQGGSDCSVDFNETPDVASDFLKLQGNDDIKKSIETTEGGNKVLRLRDTSGVGTLFSVTSREYEDLSECKGGFIRLYIPEDMNLILQVQEVDSDEQERDLYYTSSPVKKGYRDIGFFYPDRELDGNKKKVRLKFTFGAEKPGTQTTIPYVDIAMLRLCSEAPNYGVMSGTSMAAPMVTGAVATLSAVFPEDSPEKLAARITGSVLPMDGLKDRCVSGGIFRMDKAMAGDTVPVLSSAEVSGGTFSLNGFFFGSGTGTVKVGGAVCTIQEWTDTKITARLPEGFSAGEKQVEVTSPKGTGRKYLRMGTRADLYPRLPLPGSTVAADGRVVIPDKALKKYADFYGGDAKAITGAGGYLYAFVGNTEPATTIYRFKISDKTWEKVCTATGYAPMGGACAWKGKLLFMAADKEREKNAIGVLDPDRKQIAWRPIQEEGYLDAVSMINNGFGIYLIGGEWANRTENNQMVNCVRQLDPVKMEIEDLEGYSNIGKYASLGCDETGRIYAIEGFHVTAPANVTYFMIEISGKTASLKELATGSSLFPEMVNNSELGGTGVFTKDGYLVTGFPKMDDTDAVIEDTYLISQDGKKAVKQDKLMSFRPMYRMVSAGYQGTAYFLGASNSEDGQLLFTGLPAKTYDIYGEKSYSDEWVKGIRYGKDGFRDAAHPNPAGWRKNSRGWWYEDSKGWYPKNQWQKIDGKWYFFDKEGYMEKNAYRQGYYLKADGSWDGKRKTSGWKESPMGWYFSLSDGTILKNTWKKINGRWYFFEKNGVMAANRWMNYGGKWYYLEKGGAMAANRWLKYGGKWYYFGKNGAMVKGWQKLGGIWYFFKDGVMQTGWNRIGGTWYYFDQEGRMYTNAYIDKKYFVDKNGAWDGVTIKNIPDAKPAETVPAGSNGTTELEFVQNGWYVARLEVQVWDKARGESRWLYSDSCAKGQTTTLKIDTEKYEIQRVGFQIWFFGWDSIYENVEWSYTYNSTHFILNGFGDDYDFVWK